ncbi:MAG: PIN domain-containing protein [Actinomycetota bacterium]|nr:PIN domain-containing protein [Actinomycetota bacterium]
MDSGPLYAYADEDDEDHERCLALLEKHPGPFFVPVLCVSEVAYLLESRLGSRAAVKVLGDFAGGTFVAEAVAPSDWLRIAELVWQYSDLPLGTVDASVVTLAERLGATAIATLDRRHFGVVRPAHADAFELLP